VWLAFVKVKQNNKIALKKSSFCCFNEAKIMNPSFGTKNGLFKSKRKDWAKMRGGGKDESFFYESKIFLAIFQLKCINFPLKRPVLVLHAPNCQ